MIFGDCRSLGGRTSSSPAVSGSHLVTALEHSNARLLLEVCAAYE